jgi:hypothetical protein
MSKNRSDCVSFFFVNNLKSANCKKKRAWNVSLETCNSQKARGIAEWKFHVVYQSGIVCGKVI